MGGVAVKSQWGRSDAGLDPSFDGHEMMLDTDICLAFSDKGRPVNSQETDCCAWADFRAGGARCGRGHRECCGREYPRDCGMPLFPRGPAARDVREFANDEAAWLREFARAWAKATENGQDGLRHLGDLPPAPAPAPGSRRRPSFGGRRRA